MASTGSHGKHPRKPKVACENCARGKRNCSGTYPCERCTRLGKECSFPDEATRRRKMRPELSAELFPHASAAKFVPLGIPRPTALSLPRQLFPWQDIRLHMFGLHSGDDSEESEDSEDSEHKADTSPVTMTNQDIEDAACSGGQDATFLKFLWNATMQADAINSNNSGEYADYYDDEDSEDDEDDEDEHYAAAYPVSGSKRGRAANNNEEDGDVTGIAHSKRVRLSDNNGASLRFGESHSGSGRLGLGEGHGAERAIEAEALLAAEADGTTPTWVAIHDTHTYQLKHLFCNKPALQLFGWSQSEIALRVHLGHVIRWLHPEDVLVRSVIAVNARQGQERHYVFEGKYLRRRAAVDIPSDALAKIRQGVQTLRQQQDSFAVPPQLTLTRTVSNAKGTPSVPPAPASLPLAKSNSTTSVSSSRSHKSGAAAVSPDLTELESYISAFEEIDDAMIYEVFHATESVTNFYTDTGVTHMVVTKFLLSPDDDGVAGGELIRPAEYDLSATKPVLRSGVDHLMHSATSSRLGSAREHAPSLDADTLSAAAVLASSLGSQQPGDAFDLPMPTITKPRKSASGASNFTFTKPTAGSRRAAMRSSTERSITAQLRLMDDSNGFTTSAPGKPSDVFMFGDASGRLESAPLIPAPQVQVTVSLPVDYGGQRLSSALLQSRLRTGDSVRSSDMNIS